MVILARIKTAGKIGVAIIAAPLLLIPFLPLIVYFEFTDWRDGRTFRPGNPWHDEWVKWEAQRRDYDRTALTSGGGQ